MTCSRCGGEDHNVRTCEFSEEQASDFGGDECEDCIYELSGNYCPECHRGS